MRVSLSDRYWRIRERSGYQDAVEWFVKVVETDDACFFDAYVGVDRDGRVVERSSEYGLFEGRADWLAEEGAADATESSAAEFRDAWHGPQTRPSWRRRLLRRLGGIDDTRDPTV